MLKFMGRIFCNRRSLPVTLLFITTCIMIVVFRMRGVEQDYELTKLIEEVKIASLHNKELKASKAHLLSVKNLHSIADKYELKKPSSGQIIIIPD